MAVILGIESSCDETSGALCANGKIQNNIIALQSVHKNYGGVVPELASRAHQRNIVPVIHEALTTAGISVNQLDAIAFTRGPGLLGSLLVGVSFAKGLGLALDRPIIEVNHMQAHILAHFIDDPRPEFPFLCLTVSGGHTQLVRVKDYLDMEIIGQTRDDAVGEAFDKGAKMLGLPYPGGPQIDQCAASGDPNRFNFPGADIPGLDFSFSGIKTALLYFIRDHQQQDPDFVQKNMADICASVQYRLISMLLEKLERAATETGISRVALAGGVSANRSLRQRVQELAQRRGWKLFIPAFAYCTDNAAMIAMAGHYKYEAQQFSPLTVSAEPRLRFEP